MPDIVRFIGHFHPVLLHLPIGVFILIVLQELGAIFGRRHHEEVADTSMFPLFFGAASAVLAVIAGFLLFQGGSEYAGNALAERHLWGGLIFAVAGDHHLHPQGLDGRAFGKSGVLPAPAFRQRGSHGIRQSRRRFDHPRGKLPHPVCS